MVRAVEDNSEVSKEIIELYINGNKDAFRFLYKKFSYRILRFCVRILNDEEAAKDVMQEVFIKVFQNRSQFQGMNFKSWVYTIAKNSCINSIRAKKSYDELNEDIEVGYLPQINDHSLKVQIDKALNKIPIEFREAIILKDYQDYSYNEISEILGVDVNLLKVRVFRGRVILRKLLEPVYKELNEYR